MRETRRDFLGTLSAASALAVGASGLASAADCSAAPAWDATTLYSSGDRVTHPDSDGVAVLWEAALDSRNAEPSRSGAYWDYVGDCGGGGGNEAPTASFTTSMSTPAPGESVSFDASGSSDPDGTIASYSWAFGDGATDSGQTASHSYDSAGDYTVTLTVTDDAGATGTASTTVSISSESNAAPNASFTVSPSAPTVGESVTVDAADSSDSDGSISGYSWEFGDGASASGQTASHSYDAAGEYTITLTVTDDDGATDSNATTVTVEESSDGGSGADCDGVPVYDPSATYTGGDQVVHDGSLWTAEWWTQGTAPAQNENVWTLDGACGNFSPTASASASPFSPAVGESVSFDGSGSSDADGSITSYEWAFGDGATATGQTVTHSYGSSGDYTVTLTVTDDAGATGTDTVTVSVGDSGGGSAKENDIFAPYQGTWGSLVDRTLAVDTDRVVVSFVGDGTSGDGVNPGWLTSGGQRPLGDFADEIQTLQDNGVEVWVAIGGWDGRTVARDATDATELKDAYADIVDTLGVTHLDIDDENADEAGRDGSVYQIRHEALAMLQDERPEVKVSYTVPAGQNGIENRNYSPAKDMVSDAVAKGVDLSYVNIMTMNFSGDYTSIIPSAGQGTVDWLANVYPDKTEQERWEMLGVTPNVGEDNFTTDDATAIVDWAENEDLGILSFWALYKSSAPEQAGVFYGFEDDED